jgi:hypothetical protein
MSRFEDTKNAIAEVVSHSKTEEDPSHSINAWQWLLKLRPNAGEVVQLAILGHDLERALPDRLTRDQFSSYDEYKLAHATRGGEVAEKLALQNGYTKDEAARLSSIIKSAEFGSEDPDVSLVCDADSISFFDNNVEFYLRRSGSEKTKQKIAFMYSRATPRVKVEIDKILESKPNVKSLLNEAIQLIN